MKWPLIRSHRVCCLVVAVTATFVLSGCSVADLRPTAMRNANYLETPEAIELRRSGKELWSGSRQARGEVAWLQFNQAIVELRDVWRSTVLRWFTPLDTDDERLSAELQLRAGRSIVTLNRGSTTEIIARRGETTFRITSPDVGSEIELGGLTHLYVESLQRYVELPFLDAPLAVEVEPLVLDGTSYPRVFVTAGGWEPTLDADQYLYCLDPETGYVRFVEFTYRGVTRSYRGVLRYSEYQDVDGVQLAHRIEIAEDFVGDPVHTLIIEGVRFQ